ncbi:MAG: CDP-alcohol phosphatidyltransferase family protein [Candidatus Hydrogenedentes bacterium]|nr:CDP-alcohol phosphatidyltransferase family protein [Candidatus Hydrogenedentota bacterium]
MTCANRITVFRLLLVPVFCGLVFVYAPAMPWARHAALAVYALAALSDALDGYVARRWERPTPLGKRLDPLADKLLINLGFVFLAANPHLDPGVPMWFPVPLLLRDSIIVLGALLLNAFVAPVIINVRVTGKLTTLFQNITLVAALLGLSQLPWLIGATTLLVVASCAAYIYDGIQQVKTAGGQNLA